MAKACVPIMSLKYEAAQTFNLDLANILADEDATVDDEFTYTMRVFAPDDRQREKIAAKIRERLPADQAEKVLSFFNYHDWDVSFFVDVF